MRLTFDRDNQAKMKNLSCKENISDRRFWDRAQLGAVFCRSYPRTEISRHNLHLRDVIAADKPASYRNARLSYVAPNNNNDNGEKTNKTLVGILLWDKLV